MEARGRQRGVALVTALLLVAIAVVAATAMGARLQVDLRRTANVTAFEQARIHAASAEAFALDLLANLRRHQLESGEAAWDGCASPRLAFPLAEATVTIAAEDLHCRFNLNELAAAEAEAVRTAFIRLLEEVNRDLHRERVDPDLVARAVTEWLSPEDDDPYYQRREPPYRSANQPMLTADELILVRGMTDGAMDALRPYVTALPDRGLALNREAAPEPVRRALAGLEREESQAPRYLRVAITVTVDGREAHSCSVMDAEARRVIYRERARCD